MGVVVVVLGVATIAQDSIDSLEPPGKALCEDSEPAFVFHFLATPCQLHGNVPEAATEAWQLDFQGVGLLWSVRVPIVGLPSGLYDCFFVCRVSLDLETLTSPVNIKVQAIVLQIGCSVRGVGRIGLGTHNHVVARLHN